MTRLGSGVIAFWLALPLSAAADVLQLDLVLFTQPPWITARDDGRWDYQAPPQTPSIDPLQAAQAGDAVVIESPEGGLTAEVERLQAQGYTLLERLSVQFQQSRHDQAIAWQIRAGDPLLVEPPRLGAASNLMGSQWYDDTTTRQPQTHYTVDGWVRAWVDRYLFVEFDIAQFVGDQQRREDIQSRSTNWAGNLDSTLSAPTTQAYSPFGSPASPAPSGALSTLDAWPAKAVDVFRLHERKRLRLNELHYFDHPRIGMLIQVTEPPRTTLAEPGS